LQARQRMAEILRILPGSSLVVAPSDRDLAAPEMAAGLEESFGGGGYTARQRSALLQMAWDHVSSALDGRESAFELHASGGIPAWRGRLRRSLTVTTNSLTPCSASSICRCQRSTSTISAPPRWLRAGPSLRQLERVSRDGLLTARRQKAGPARAPHQG
jgi:4-hydroxyphenylacetate 3-hydroxylase C terminal